MIVHVVPNLGLYNLQCLQAAQVRKSSFVCEGPSLGRHGYHPTTHHASTVHAGTYVQQVSSTSKFIEVCS